MESANGNATALNGWLTPTQPSFCFRSLSVSGTVRRMQDLSMELSELRPTEQLVLVGLAKAIVHADHEVTREETAAIRIRHGVRGPRAGLSIKRVVRALGW